MGVWIYFLIIFMIPICAQWKVRRVHRKCSMYNTVIQLTGAQCTRKMLNECGLVEVKIEEIQDTLHDYYDPKKKTVFLSQDTFHNTHLAALVVASHEVGHAIQHKEGDSFLRIRHAFLPFVNIGASFSWILMFIGMTFDFQRMITFSGVLLISAFCFQLITLPVEWNANARAKKLMNSLVMIQPDEEYAMKKLLHAAVFTYIVSIFFVFLEFVRFFFFLIKKK